MQSVLRSLHRRKFAVIALLLSILFGVGGQLLMKLAAMRSTGVPGQLSTFATVTLAFAVYSFGIVFWALALRRFTLGAAYAVTSLSHAGILWGSFYWLGEHISAVRAMGAALTLAGVLLVVLARPRTTPLGPVSSPAPIGGSG
jgi:multidrug transporter EmrE-like cation transporter